MEFLYNLFDNPFVKELLAKTEIPNYVVENLKNTLRPYQMEAMRRFIFFNAQPFEGKQKLPYHLLLNMATGSGKTMMMAAMMLYLYEKGYRTFIFFVNSNTIIRKTKENFLNVQSSKYEFAKSLRINEKEVNIKEIENLDEADNENINIKFVSIQMLTSGLLLNVKENGLSFDDFENRKIVLIGDEAHHNNAEVWGSVVEQIHKKNFENILLEFTATTDYENKEIANKYKDKVLYRYDLRQFRADKFSKEINLLRSEYDEKYRIVQAILLNYYRQALAASVGINLKPVILFKAKATIAESEQNKHNFHELIANLSVADLEHVATTTTVPLIKKAFAFFSDNNIQMSEVVERLKYFFKPENCLSANNDKEKEKNQLLLNSLEDNDNPIRAIFAVQKLNEGWDVLNLFDIVRLYEGQNSGGSNKGVGKTTLSEAQLIGRGARYFPFKIEEGQEKYCRKYDNSNSDLKVLEELVYHTKEDSRYVSELKRALVETGMVDDEEMVTKQLRLKTDFKATDFYKNGYVVYNKKIEKDYRKIHSFRDLNVTKTNICFKLSSGLGIVTVAFDEQTQNTQNESTSKDISVGEMPRNVLQYALSGNKFFLFSSLRKYFPHLKSIAQLIESKEYLQGCSITFEGTKERINNISNQDYLLAINALLNAIANEIKQNSCEYEGSNFVYKFFRDIFGDKDINVSKNSERARGQEELVGKLPWYVYNANYGTSEEKDFVSMFARKYEAISKKYNNIFLVRNEQTLKIYDKKGRAFEPDFLLFCSPENNQNIVYQIFIEPKGEHLMLKDKWKEVFLEDLRNQANQKILKIYTNQYIITGVPFYNSKNENEFSEHLQKVLKI